MTARLGTRARMKAYARRPHPQDADTLTLPPAAVLTVDRRPVSPGDTAGEDTAGTSSDQGGHAGQDTPEDTAGRVPFAERTRGHVLPDPVRDFAADPRAGLSWAGHQAARHALASPWYLARVLRLAWAGALRAVPALWRWLSAAETDPLLIDTAKRGRTGEFERARETRRRLREDRFKAAGKAAAVPLVVVLVVAIVAGPRTAVLLAVTGTVATLAVYGRRGPDVPAGPVPPAALTGPAAKPTPEKIHAAFDHAGIAGVVCLRGAHRVANGWEQVVELPYGKDTYDDAAKLRKKIAGNLDTTAPCLFMDPATGPAANERQVRLWIADRDPFDPTLPRLPFPLLDPKVKAWDFWRQGVPIGTTAKGELVVLPLLWTSLLVGAQPRVGKTFTVAEVACCAAMDPWVRLIIADFKNGGDYKGLARRCSEFITGNDTATAKRLLAVLRQVLDEVRTRNARFGELPAKDRPDGKVTYELAHTLGSGYEQIVVVVDELQNALEDPEHGDDIRAVLVTLAREAPSQLVMLVLSTQRPTRELLGDLRSFMGARFALSVQEEVDSRMILGTDHVAGVIDSSLIPKAKKGVGILSGGEDSALGDLPAQMLRTCGLRLADLDTVCERALAACQEAGTLGVLTAAGAAPVASTDSGQRSFLSVVREVPRPAGGMGALHLATIAQELAERDPAQWGGLDVQAVGRLVRAEGVTPRRVRETPGGAQKYGLDADQLAP